MTEPRPLARLRSPARRQNFWRRKQRERQMRLQQSRRLNGNSFAIFRRACTRPRPCAKLFDFNGGRMQSGAPSEREWAKEARFAHCLLGKSCRMELPVGLRNATIGSMRDSVQGDLPETARMYRLEVEYGVGVRDADAEDQRLAPFRRARIRSGFLANMPPDCDVIHFSLLALSHGRFVGSALLIQ